MAYYPIFFGLAATLALVCLVLYFFPRPSRMRQRLQAQVKWVPVLVQAGDLARVLPAGLAKKMEEKLGLGKDSPKAREIKKTLVQAGFSSERASSVYMGGKIGLALGLPILALPFLLQRSSSTVFLMGALYFLVMIGYSIPSLILKRLVARRKTLIRESLPDALDPDGGLRGGGPGAQCRHQAGGG